MARPLRLEYAGALYHLTARGDRREDIFFGDEDRTEFLSVVGEVCERFNWVVHAYCQMTKHYHAVVETPEGNLSKGMRHLNGVYTQFVNRTHGRSGHVFQGRFKGILVERDSYLLELIRYVVLNSVRAGMVGDAKEWAWSSHRVLLGTAPKPDWLVTDWGLGQFGGQRSEAIRGYEDFVRASVGLPSIWEGLTGQIFLGSAEFADEMRKARLDGNRLRAQDTAQDTGSVLTQDTGSVLTIQPTTGETRPYGGSTVRRIRAADRRQPAKVTHRRHRPNAGRMSRPTGPRSAHA